MGVYTRYKGKPGGFRALVELLETTPQSRREKMVSVGMLEDPAFTTKALELMLTWEDILALPEPELAEVVAKAPARITGYALHHVTKEFQTRFLRCAPPLIAAEIRDMMEVSATNFEVSGARMKLIQTARECERAGYVRVKQIPENP